ncbi:BAG domain-containing protein Samui-like isoform X2 [Adelges cooleyi]|uniref:BAG domain-containing protein Samui-like isoform X2 n=1 Tax=Adelges cooleyi TaxID=133065 RepID=UPI0021803B4A|nr:BAG domain-containing protein Samui-like isoform X2 [Adelges cooleyi]
METTKIDSTIYPRPPSETSALEEFPFDDDMLLGHLSVRSHLEDLAKKHPDIADHLRCPPWGGEPSSKRSNKRNVSGDENTSEVPSDLNQNSTEHIESSPDQKRFEDNMDNQQQNPSENISDLSGNNDDKAQQRFISKLEFTPMNASNPTENVQQQQPQQQQQQTPPPVHQQQQQPPPQQQQQQHKEPQRDSTPPQGAQKPHVRVIPIQVEGRSNPVYPKDTDKMNEMGSNVPKQNLGKTQFPHHSFYDQNTSQRRQTPPPSSHQQQHAAPQEPRSTPPPPPPPRQQTKPLDALEKVRIVQADVEELAKDVAQFSGNSRSDKQFIYLDEMLTRNLIKLDTIETEGRDDVRIARKKAIKTIQDNIAILEDKVPQTKSEPMVVEQSNEESEEPVQSENQQPETQQSQTDVENSKK